MKNGALSSFMFLFCNFDITSIIGHNLMKDFIVKFYHDTNRCSIFLSPELKVQFCLQRQHTKLILSKGDDKGEGELMRRFATAKLKTKTESILMAIAHKVRIHWSLGVLIYTHSNLI